MRSRFSPKKGSPPEEEAPLIQQTSSLSTLSTASLSPQSANSSSTKWLDKKSMRLRRKNWYTIPLLVALDLLSSLLLLKHEIVSSPFFFDNDGSSQNNQNQNLESMISKVITGTEMAVSISQNLLLQPSSLQDETYSGLRGNNSLSTPAPSYQKYSIPDSEWFIDLAAIGSALSSPEGCLVYSFGIGEDDSYTNFMATKGCQVFAFDPTQLHPTDWKPNVTFFSWGIRNSHDTGDIGWSHPKYGNIMGALFSLPEIVEKLGHQGQSIAALKFDCEGCEYGAFQDIVTYEQASETKFNAIGSLSTEFHFSTTLGMRTLEDVANIRYTNIFLQSQDCRVIHYKPNRGFKKDRSVHPHLVKHGVVNGTCCYEYGFSCNGAGRVSEF